MIFPNIKVKKQDNVNLNNLREIAWDFVRDEPVVKNNDFVIVTGIDALRVWAYKTLKTRRYRYITYSNSYGVYLNTFIGKIYDPIVERQIKKEISDALLVNKYIDRVNILRLSLDGTKFSVELDITTKDGQLEVSVDV